LRERAERDLVKMEANGRRRKWEGAEGEWHEREAILKNGQPMRSRGQGMGGKKAGRELG